MGHRAQARFLVTSCFGPSVVGKSMNSDFWFEPTADLIGIILSDSHCACTAEFYRASRRREPHHAHVDGARRSRLLHPPRQ